MATDLMNTATGRRRAVLVTGANGYIGAAVCRAFVRAGWQTFGLVRRPEATRDLAEAEVIPVLGSFADLSFLDLLFEKSNTFDAIVNCTEPLPGYAAHMDDVLALVKAIANVSNGNGVKPLLLMSSGCKDYGCTGLYGSPDLVPHTEESPLDSPTLLAERAVHSLRIFDYSSVFDAALLRPTSVFGYGSSYYGGMLRFAAAEKAAGARKLVIPADARTIMHAMHVDDCAEAYVALAEHPERGAVAGEAFNVSGFRYETTGEVGGALAEEYGFEDGVRFVPMTEAGPSYPRGLDLVFSFSQWVGSDKIRTLTGWADQRALFSENLGVYREAFEVAEAKGDSGVALAEDRISGTLAGSQKEAGD